MAAYLPAIIASVWLGFFSAISFMESWLKFRAPGVTLNTGLAIGMLVFKFLNRVEWFFAVLLAVSLAVHTGSSSFLLWCLPAGILAIQTFGTLPRLNNRSQLRLRGIDPGPSRLHFAFVALESAKALSLVLFTITHFNQ
jgi:hypothetical protein